MAHVPRHRVQRDEDWLDPRVLELLDPIPELPPHALSDKPLPDVDP